MKLTGTIVTKDGIEVQAFLEIVNLSITEGIDSIGVHLYYLEGEKRKYICIDGSITKRYNHELDPDSPLNYTKQAYEHLLTLPPYKNFHYTD